MWKSDFKAAYRCLPVHPSEYEISSILIFDPRTSTCKVARQYAMPFGSLAAVYAWDRVGHALAHVIQHFILIPVNRYVDDLFGLCPEVFGSYVRGFIVELITLVGFCMDVRKTLLPSSTMVILGNRNSARL